MKRRVFFATAMLFALVLPRTAGADTVRLKNGYSIQGVRAEIQGDEVYVELEHGSTRFPKDEIIDIVKSPNRKDLLDELASRKLAAKDEPGALRELASWARRNGLRREAEDLEQTAKGIELDRRLDAIKDATTTAPYLALAQEIKRDHSFAERKVVLERALAVDPDDAQVHLELGQVKRAGQWMALAEAARIDADADEQAMKDKGLVKCDGRWVAPEVASLIEERKALAREREQLRKERERLAAEKAFADDAARRAAARRDEDAGSYHIDATPDYNNDPTYTNPLGNWRPWASSYYDPGYGYYAGYGYGTTVIIGPGRGYVTVGAARRYEGRRFSNDPTSRTYENRGSTSGNWSTRGGAGWSAGGGRSSGGRR